MECFIVNLEDVFFSEGYFILRNEEAHHAVKSLRVRPGEGLLATDLQGMCYRGVLDRVEEEKRNAVAYCRIEAELPNFNEPTIAVELVQAALNQASKFEEIVERCTEIGVSCFTPVSTQRTERPALKQDRLVRILHSACKQSSRARMPILQEIQQLESALASSRESGREIILLHEAAPKEISLRNVLDKMTFDKLSIVVGPEGGFSDEEVRFCREKYDTKVASLGTRRLRAETAAITAAAIALSYDPR